MFAGAPERRMRGVRAVLLVLWLMLIGSLFYDPITPFFTRPENAASPFRINPSSQVMVQGQVLPIAPYPMGARIFWTMIIPIVPMFLMLFGHEAWRRVCPLSLSTQLPQFLNVQVKARVFNRKTGQVEKRTRLLKAESLAARYVWFIQFGFLWCGITGRLLFINSDRMFLACFLLSLIGMAALVGLFFGGKSWCNYFCPIAPVQKIYTGPGGLLESKAYRTQGVTQSMCRKHASSGDQSTCVGCVATCPDIDLERFYWDSMFRPGKRFAYYGYFGLVLGFYSYYYFYSGNWGYYFSGAWTHEAGQLQHLFSPGFYVAGTPLPIPKLLAAPLTTGLFVLLAYALGRSLESIYGRLRSAIGRPLSPEGLRHQALTMSAFATFNVFYLFGGRPNLALLPAGLLKAVDVCIVLASTLWLSRALRSGHAVYRRESLAQNMLRQLKRLKVDFAAILGGRTLDDLNADEVNILATTMSGLPVEKRHDLYRGVLVEALHRGEINAQNGLESTREIRQQMGISEEEHDLIMSPLLKLQQGAAAGGVQEPASVRLLNYMQALETIVGRSLESGNPAREELGTRENDREVRKLRNIFDVSDAEHEEILAALLGERNLALREAEGLLEDVADAAVRMKALAGPGIGSRIPGVELLVHHLERRRRSLGLKFLSVLQTVPDSADRTALARWFNVFRSGTVLESADLGSPGLFESPAEDVPVGLLDILREDAGKSLEILNAGERDGLAAFRSRLSSQPDPIEFLAQTAGGREVAPAAVALSVLARLTSERAKALTSSVLAAGTRSWLWDEVVQSIADDGRGRMAQPASHQDGTGDDY